MQGVQKKFPLKKYGNVSTATGAPPEKKLHRNPREPIRTSTIIAGQMDFSRVLVRDNLAWELFSAAARENLLFSRPLTEEERSNLSRRSRLTRQRALSLLVLFDHLVLHDYCNAFRLPDLEKDGIVEVMAGSDPVEEVPPLPTLVEQGAYG